MVPATQDAVVLELMTMGQKSAAYLGELLRASSPHQELAAEILRCCGRVIAAVRAGGGKKRKAVQLLQHEDVAAAACSPATPPRKRPRGAEAALGVVTTTGTTVDGFIWRKYGQKEINGRKHPRLYYRCAYRDLQGCPATRRVQRTHGEGAEPPAYEIAYYGEHTCAGAAAACRGRNTPPPPAVVDFGSNVLVGAAPASEQRQPQQLLLSWDGEVSSQGGWSSSEAGFDAQTTHQWHDTSPVEEPSAAAPCYAPDPMTEFLDGSFDWASVLDDHRFGFGALHHITSLQ